MCEDDHLPITPGYWTSVEGRVLFGEQMTHNRRHQESSAHHTNARTRKKVHRSREGQEKFAAGDLGSGFARPPPPPPPPSHTRTRTQMSQEELEKFAAGNLDEVSDDATLLLGDKDIVLASLNASHDAHVSVIDGWEEAVVSRERKNYQALVVQARKESVERDRRRVLETVSITERNNREIEELILNEDTGYR